MSLKRLIKENKEFIENKEDMIYDYMSGDCIHFAVALQEHFPEYEFEILYDEKEEGIDFVHVYCYHPSNNRIIIDAEGVRSKREMLEYFHDIDPYIDGNKITKEELINDYAGKEFYSEETYDWDKSTYKEAKEFIELFKEDYKI